MSPVYLNPQHSSSMPFLELKGDHQQLNHSLSLVAYLHDHVGSTNGYFSHSNLVNHHDSDGIQALDYDYSRRAQEKVEKLVISQVKAANEIGKIVTTSPQKYSPEDGSGCSFTYPFDNRDHQIESSVKGSDQSYKKSKKCRPAKLRIMQKMTTTSNKSKIIADHHQHKLLHNNNNPQSKLYRYTASNENDNNGVRVCTDCHTTTTPLWRSGPQGPKSLCNACGIRQRKARRAATAAAAAAAAAAELAKNATTVSLPISSSSHVEDPKLKVEEMSSERKLDHERSHTLLPIKKRSKITTDASRNYINNSHNNGEFALRSSNNKFTAKSQRTFPRDEEEGAILLMALSCGLACSS